MKLHLWLFCLVCALAACGASPDPEPRPISEEEDQPVKASPVTASRPSEDAALLKTPDHEVFKAPAPEKFRAVFETTAGSFEVEVIRAWSPHGADRFYHLARLGYYDDIRVFRMVRGFVAQFGMSGDPALTQVWGKRGMPDDKVRQSNARGMLTYAKTSMPNSRSTQLFINLRNNRQLDGMGFAPFARVIRGMEVVDKFHAGYGDGPPTGSGPDQGQIQQRGNTYLDADFPKLSKILSVRVVTDQP